jgi:hypothetical protein
MSLPVEQRALARSRAALGAQDGRPLLCSEASVYLKYLLLEALADTAELGSYARRTDLRSLLSVRLDSLIPALFEAGRVQEVECVALALRAPSLYRERVLDLAQEALFSQPLAPDLCLFPRPLTLEEQEAALPGERLHAVVFAVAPLFAHEFYPLAVDAFARDSQVHGRPFFNVLGVHLDWFDSAGRFQRAIYLDADRNLLCEADLGWPMAPHSAHCLCLGRAERALHARFAARLACPLVNPAAPSALADDKAATLKGWSALGLEVPAFLKVGPGEMGAARAFMAQYRELVAKPNGGTEGEQVLFLENCYPEAQAMLQSHLETCWQKDEALLQERRDGLLFCDPLTNALHTLALRLNAAFDGRDYWIESAYAQIGANARTPAAAGQGGKLIDLPTARAHLVTRRHGLAVDLTPAAWERICLQAKDAAGLFAGLLLVGLDVLLDLDQDGAVQAVFLEANPRPAGLSRAQFLADGLQGVTLKMWDGLHRQCAASQTGTAA